MRAFSHSRKQILSGRICLPAKQNNSAAWQRKVPLIKRGEMHIASVQFIISSVASSHSSIWAARRKTVNYFLPVATALLRPLHHANLRQARSSCSGRSRAGPESL